MKGLLKFVIGLVLGAIMAAYGMGFTRMVVYQEGYQEGRANTLTQVVTLGGPKPCNISISIGFIAEMVEAGILEWHKTCVESVKEGRG